MHTTLHDTISDSFNTLSTTVNKQHRNLHVIYDSASLLSVAVIHTQTAQMVNVGRVLLIEIKTAKETDQLLDSEQTSDYDGSIR